MRQMGRRLTPLRSASPIYLRQTIGHDWTNQVIFEQHKEVNRSLRDARRFMKTGETALDDRWRNHVRTIRLAELLFNLQHVPGIYERVELLRAGQLESVYSDLEDGSFLYRRGVPFEYVTPTGMRGFDYDARIVLQGGAFMPVEMKCNIESTDLTRGAVRGALETARKQLPKGEPGLIFLKIPEAWLREPIDTVKS